MILEQKFIKTDSFIVGVDFPQHVQEMDNLFLFYESTK